MGRLLTDPDRLRAKLKELLNARKGRLEGLARAEALVECCFRLAAHPSTPPLEAIQLLHRAWRLDGSNPKHAYLLARQYFVCGELDRAAAWLETAARRCSTSHRIWTHISLLQWELNARYRGNESFEPDDLRRRSRQILDRVLQGADEFEPGLLDFKPRPSTASLETKARMAGESLARSGGPAVPSAGAPDAASQTTQSKRLDRAGRCRWSGAVDLALEEMLESEPNELTRTRAEPLLRQIARFARVRRGGVSAFVISSVQWCLAGYPVETVVRLRKILPPAPRCPSLWVLDHVCQVLSAEEAQVPVFLADALKQGHLPPMLAALIHDRRLLCQPLEFGIAGRCRIARRLLADGSDPQIVQKPAKRSEQIAELIKAIEQATAGFIPGSRTLPRDESVSPEPVEAGEAIARLAELEPQVKALNRIWSEALRRLDDSSVVCTAADVQAVEEFAGAFEEVAEKASSRLDALCVAAFALGDRLPETFGRQALHRRRELNVLRYGPQLRLKCRLLTVRSESAGAIRSRQSAIGPGLAELTKQLASVSGSRTDSGTSTTESPEESIERLDREVSEIESHLSSYGARLRQLETTLKQPGKLGEADLVECARISRFVDDLPKRIETSLKSIGDLRASNKVREEATMQRLDATKARYQDIGPHVGSCQKKLRKLLPPGATVTSAPAPAAVEATARKSSPVVSPTPAPATVSPSRSTTPGPPSITGLAAALERLERQVDDRFAQLRSTFDSYSRAGCLVAPLRALWLSVLARQAEILYRLGRPAEAQRVWNHMLREDRLNADVMNNLAVCQSLGSGSGGELTTWRRYLELLYFQGVADGSPHSHARQRAEFHRQFGSGYAPVFLLPPESKDKELPVDPLSLLAFLESPARLHAFVEHKLLEWFDRKLDFTSPTLLLGCGRTDGEKTRTDAKEKLLVFLDRMRGLLPPRVREAFSDLVRKRLCDAAEASMSARRLASEKGPVYEAGLKRQEQWLKDICMFKHHIARTLAESKELPQHMTSPLFLTQLVRLDEVPLDLSRPRLEAVIRGLQAVEAEYFLGLMRRTADKVLENLVRFLQDEQGEAAAQTLRGRQFGRLRDQWLQDPIVRASEPVKFLLVEKASQAGKRGEVAESLSLLTAALDMDDRLPVLANNVLAAFIEAARTTRRADLHKQMAAAFQGWQDRAKRRLRDGGPTADENEPAEHRLTLENVKKVGRFFHTALVQVYLAPLGELGEQTDWLTVVRAMTDLLAVYPDVIDAHHMRMFARRNLAGLASHAQNREQTARYLREALEDAEIVAKKSADAEHRQQAERLQQEAKEVMARL